jgi:eukaryotic-like serine/threonine-protein kinase
VGRKLGDGRYELIAELGRGGMATVWRAKDTRLGVERAVKMLSPQLAGSSGTARMRFLREAQLMARLEHPHVASVHDVGSDGTEAYLVMSLLRGGSVQDHLDRFGPMPPRQAVGVVIGVLEALAAAHDQGVVHRDVKPHNVLIDDQGQPRLSDFGIARVTGEGMTRTGAIMGTWAYMAPEQRSDAKQADPRSDVYGAGALLVALCSAQEPHDLHNAESHDRQLKPVHAGLRPFVERATRYRAEDRYGSAREAIQVLQEVAPELPPDPPGTPGLGRYDVLAETELRGATAHTLSPDETRQTLAVDGRSDTTAAGSTFIEDPDAAAPASPAPLATPSPGSAGALAVGGAFAVGSVVAGVAAMLAIALCLGVGPWGTDPPAAQIDEPVPAEVPATVAPTVPAPAGPVSPAPGPLGPGVPALDGPLGPGIPALDGPLGPGIPALDGPLGPAPARPAPTAPAPVPVQPAASAPATPAPAAPQRPSDPSTTDPAGPRGALAVSSIPWSHVYVDDQAHGKTPVQLDLPVGSHRLRLVSGIDQTSVARTQRVEDGERTIFCWDFAADGPCPP